MKEKKLRANLTRSKIVEIVESIHLVSENLPDSFENFSKLGLVKDGIYKRTECAIENGLFDICAIINSDLLLEMPENDYGIAENLVKRSILTQEMAEKIRKMRGFRNIMVHRYGRIEDEIEYNILRNSLDDFSQFIGLIERFLETNG
jgi:uncharacterized protein YutE (UPF0331/DUF86 family)